jgi:hypothetical protein
VSMGSMVLQLVDAQASSGNRDVAALIAEGALLEGLYETAGPQFPSLDMLEPFPQDGRILDGFLPETTSSSAPCLQWRPMLPVLVCIMMHAIM